MIFTFNLLQQNQNKDPRYNPNGKLKADPGTPGNNPDKFPFTQNRMEGIVFWHKNKKNHP